MKEGRARVASVFFWSVIPAAFVGPGTVTTCALAGARHGSALLWALLFSIVACAVLQEAATRVTILTGRPLWDALRSGFDGRFARLLVDALIVGAILLGCAAYQAGNILGAVEGAALGLPYLSRGVLTCVIGGAAGLLLWFGRTRVVTGVLALTVAAMGVTFVLTALLLPPSPADIARGLLLPAIPHGAGLLVLGLVGTTVVPYNLFLGSGLSRGRRLAESRFGLAVAVAIGGVISMGILVTGTAVEGRFGFDTLAATLAGRLGPWAGPLFGAGLFAAGFSSSITAPLAAALTARSLRRPAEAGHTDRSWPYRAVWLAVLLTGVVFGFSGAAPIPIILVAQAFNGVLLPLLAAFLFLVVNDRRVLGDDRVNGWRANLAFGAVLMVTIALGVTGIVRAVTAAFGLAAPPDGPLLSAAGAAALIAGIPIAVAAWRRRR